MNLSLRLLTFAIALQVSFVLTAAQSSSEYRPVHVTHSVEYDSPIDDIWVFFARFDSISKWDTNFISSCLVEAPFSESFKSSTGECLIRYNRNTPVGSIRDLSVKDKHVYEQLLVSDAGEHRISYQQFRYPESRISLSPLPARFIHEYTNVNLYAKALNRTKVIWSASLRSEKPADLYDAYKSVYTRAGEGIRKTVQMLKERNIRPIDYLQ
ncbi:hypothetical protein K493DRAFT_296344 [Basidiobolus meristosporus CBS 931.73]|uniref:Bet v1-like protein n=1 Tax=Basidiobolus meristosporus CBS 931.73 TaxID=1314790 RepID=A0A1Y1Z6N8_9FUNG|nr:hypothetical protein K493DRAFT_296344 [Basidiobolus meristosporus CBS 931.73]|eukprot:ORY05784.1 hypothetical protein K493DRAFT_296344 [Basidiobolus meristosporus CBS 931.73]